jgi:hypothetical protein
MKQLVQKVSTRHLPQCMQAEHGVYRCRLCALATLSFLFCSEFGEVQHLDAYFHIMATIVMERALSCIRNPCTTILNPVVQFEAKPCTFGIANCAHARLRHVCGMDYK